MPKNKHVYKIVIKKDDKYYLIFKIGYYPKGGFFIKDLIVEENSGYLIHKIRTPRNLLPGEKFLAPFSRKNSWHVFIKPKLSHHRDGNAHISETGIRSGFFSSKIFRIFRKFKGVGIKSTDLDKRNNDGGPLFVFSAWGISKFIELDVIDKECIIFDDFEFNLIDNDKHSYVFEGFYLPKEAKSRVYLSDRIDLLWEGYGLYKAKCINENDNNPGFIALAYSKRILEEGYCNWEYGISINGAPGFPKWSTLFSCYEQISIAGPLKNFENLRFTPKSIAFNGVWKVISLIDRFFEKFFI